jgi:hypothetical protein
MEDQDAVSFKTPRRTQSVTMHRIYHSASSKFALDPLNADRMDEFDGLTLGKLPAQHERVKSALVMKLCQDGEWQPRIIILTSDLLIIALPDSNNISDKLPLVRMPDLFMVSKGNF